MKYIELHMKLTQTKKHIPYWVYSAIKIVFLSSLNHFNWENLTLNFYVYLLLLWFKHQIEIFNYSSKKTVENTLK